MTNETKHTPGKWKVKTFKWKDYLGYNHTETIIVTAYNHAQIKGPAPVVARWKGLPEKEGDPPRSFIGIESNDAKLIACAPELLVALEHTTDSWCKKYCGARQSIERNRGCGQCWVRKHVELIARAKGGSE